MIHPLGEAISLSKFYDQSSGQYFALELPEDPGFQAVLADAKRRHVELSSRIAVVDSGLMLDHPLIKRNLIKSVDFTGEGPQDSIGHGTLVALIILARMPKTPLFNVKVINSDGRASEDNIIKGIKWSVAEGAEIINLSVGVYREKYGLPECKGDCELCRAAEDATKDGVIICAAAGNEPGVTCCPAKVGVVKNIPVIAVAAYVPETDKMAPYSGVGTVASPELRCKLVAVE